MPSKILGREPAVFFGLCASVLLALIQFLPAGRPELFGALNALVLAGAGFMTAAWVSAEKALPALVGLVQAVFAAFLAYGSPVPESTQTAILALIAAIVAFYVRGQVVASVSSEGGNRIQAAANAAYDNGYQSGQDDMVYDQDAPAEQHDPVPPSIQTSAGAHGLTDVLPAVKNDTDRWEDQR